MSSLLARKRVSAWDLKSKRRHVCACRRLGRRWRLQAAKWATSGHSNRGGHHGRINVAPVRRLRRGPRTNPVGAHVLNSGGRPHFFRRLYSEICSVSRGDGRSWEHRIRDGVAFADFLLAFSTRSIALHCMISAPCGGAEERGVSPYLSLGVVRMYCDGDCVSSLVG